MATYSSILAWEIPWTGSLVGSRVHGVERVGRDRVTKQQQYCVPDLMLVSSQDSLFFLIFFICSVFCHTLK